jgi:hypothetical protein
VIERRTAVVQGALALGMRRLRAAQANECGIQILTLPQLAAHLAGGFLRPASVVEIEPAIQEALKRGGFQDLESVRHLPGMTRAVLRTLRKAWDSGVALQQRSSESRRRIADLLAIE